jgi:hypothetical protein
LRIWLSAVACEPNKGAGPEVDFRSALTAASRHDFWVLTVPESLQRIGRAVEGDAKSSRTHLVAMPPNLLRILLPEAP